MDSISLSYEELVLASTAAGMNTSRVLKRGADRSDHGQSTERGVTQRLANDILGEIGERAVARKIEAVQTRGTELREIGDLSGEHEVKTTEYDGGHLLLHEDSPDDARFFLAVVSFDDQIRVSLPGWLRGREGKKDRFWGNRGSQKQPCYWVPQDQLRSYSALDILTK